MLQNRTRPEARERVAAGPPTEAGNLALALQQALLLQAALLQAALQQAALQQAALQQAALLSAALLLAARSRQPYAKAMVTAL